MAASKLARSIVLKESPLAMTTSFIQAMGERTTAILEGLRSEVSQGILLDGNFDTKLDCAVDYVIREVNESGINSLNEAILKSSTIFKINHSDLVAFFESAFEETEVIDEALDYNKFQNSFLSRLDQILEENSGNILGFLDTTSTYVTPDEGRALVEVYSNLDATNKKVMVEKLISSKQEFKKILEFADAVITEEDIDEKHIGFEKLKGELAHKKGITNPGAVAAAIGRKKYGKKKMAHAAASGHELSDKDKK